jgi:hypothetical protein
MRRFATISLGLALFIAAISCGPSREELQSAARSLVPEGASIVAEVDGQCVELAPAPSCVHIYFVPPTLSMQVRVVEVARRADAAGWTLIDKERLQGGTQLHLEKPDVRAVVSVHRNDEVAACQATPRRQCADTAMVEGDFGL